MLRYNMCLDTNVINSHHQIFIQVMMCKVKVYLFCVYTYVCKKRMIDHTLYIVYVERSGNDTFAFNHLFHSIDNKNQVASNVETGCSPQLS